MAARWDSKTQWRVVVGSKLQQALLPVCGIVEVRRSSKRVSLLWVGWFQQAPVYKGAT